MLMGESISTETATAEILCALKFMTSGRASQQKIGPAENRLQTIVIKKFSDLVPEVLALKKRLKTRWKYCGKPL
jgi:hypothetical protein